MILRRTNDNYAKNLLESGLLKRFHGYGDVHVMGFISTPCGCSVVRRDCKLLAAHYDNKPMQYTAILTAVKMIIFT